MRTKLLMGALILVVALALVRSSNGQVQSVPGPGTGVVFVSGKVDVENVVRAAQAGDWKMSVANVADVRVTNTPVVTLSALPFVSEGARYEIVWAQGDRESIRVMSTGTHGWVRVESTGRRRWVNLSTARAIEEVQ
jgi:hypothetical protein